MFAISRQLERLLFTVICAVIGFVMFYRGVIAFMWHDYPAWDVLGVVFFGGVIAIALMYLGSKIGFWLFVLFDFAVGYMFIFVLEDRWYDHVAPHILYALVFVPFYYSLRWNWPAPPRQSAQAAAA